MPVLSYQVNAIGYGGVNPKLIYIFTNDPISVVTTTGYIDWLANQQGIYTGDVALVVTRQTPTSIFGANFYEFQRVGTGPHWNLVPESGGSGVDSVTGTLHQLIATPTTGDVVISIDPDPRLPGTGSVGLPGGTNAQRAGIAGSIRFNSQQLLFEVTVDGSTWTPIQTGSPGAVTSIIGTLNQIVASSPTGNVTISIDPDPILPGTAAVTLPTGTTGQRGSIAGSIRMNNQINAIELTNNGTDWYVVSTGNDTVNSVSGTANRITVTGTDNVVVDISAAYVGQTSITTLGTVTTGTWNATPVTVPFGGTGDTSFTAYSVICGGTTSTGNLQSVASVGTSSQVLTSNGPGALPTWQAAPGSGTGATFWLNATGSGTLLDSVGVSSVTHPGTGQLTVNLTNAFTDNYAILISTFFIADGITYGVISSSASSFTVKNGFSVGHDPGVWYICGFGTT